MIISKEMVTFAELNKQSMMKRTILTLVTLLMMVSAWSQTDEISKEQADKLNAINVIEKAANLYATNVSS